MVIQNRRLPHYCSVSSQLLTRLSAATSHLADQTISSPFRGLALPLALSVLPCGIVVAPSPFGAWLMIVSFESFHEFTRFLLHISMQRALGRLSSLLSHRYDVEQIDSIHYQRFAE